MTAAMPRVSSEKVKRPNVASFNSHFMKALNQAIAGMVQPRG